MKLNLATKALFCMGLTCAALPAFALEAWSGQEYEALFYTVGDDPSLAANQNPTGSNGRPWKPLGAVTTYTQDQLNKAPVYNSSTL